ATRMAPIALTASAGAGSDSQASTRWKAAAFTMTSGAASRTAEETAAASVTSTSARRGRISSWLLPATRTSSVPSCPHPPKTRRRTAASAGAARVVGDPGDALLAAGRAGEDVAVPADDAGRFLQRLHPLDVVVARVREIRQAARADLANHAGDGGLHADAG